MFTKYLRDILVMTTQCKKKIRRNMYRPNHNQDQYYRYIHGKVKRTTKNTYRIIVINKVIKLSFFLIDTELAYIHVNTIIWKLHTHLLKQNLFDAILLKKVSMCVVYILNWTKYSEESFQSNKTTKYMYINVNKCMKKVR